MNSATGGESAAHADLHGWRWCRCRRRGRVIAGTAAHRAAVSRRTPPLRSKRSPSEQRQGPAISLAPQLGQIVLVLTSSCDDWQTRCHAYQEPEHETPGRNIEHVGAQAAESERHQ